MGRLGEFGAHRRVGHRTARLVGHLRGPLSSICERDYVTFGASIQGNDDLVLALAIGCWYLAGGGGGAEHRAVSDLNPPVARSISKFFRGCTKPRPALSSSGGIRSVSRCEAMKLDAVFEGKKVG
jgi:hypothetical protein